VSAADINYVGFVEGHDIFSDPWSMSWSRTDSHGHIALKVMEGAYTPALTQRDARRVRAHAAAQAGLSRGAADFKCLRARIDPRRYNGAAMVGLNGIVIKSHGGTDQFGFQRAIEVAILEARDDVPAQIAQRMSVLRGA